MLNKFSRLASGLSPDFETNESPWFCRRLDLLDSDQGLVGPLCIVERSFELCGWNVVVVAVEAGWCCASTPS